MKLQSGDAFFNRLSDADLINARSRLKQIENPLGLVLVDNHLAQDYSSFMLENRGMMISLSKMLAQCTRFP